MRVFHYTPIAVVLAVTLSVIYLVDSPAVAATASQINTAWDTVAVDGIDPINSLPDNTPLLDIIDSGLQSDLNKQLERLKDELNAIDVPAINLDSATLGDVRYCLEFSQA